MTGAEAIFLVGVILLGGIVGSFLNVVIHRVPRGTFFSDGARSICANPECRAPVAWYDNIPVASWLVLRGRARCCGTAIRWRYPLVELVTAVMFGLLWVVAPRGAAIVDGVFDGSAALAFVFLAFFVANLIANTFIDIDHRILPDVLTKSAVVVGLIGALVIPGLAGRFHLVGLGPSSDSFLFSLAGALAGYCITQGVRVSARAAFGREAMGYGDVKLMAAIGAFLGWQGVLWTFFLGCLLGAVIGMVHRYFTRDPYISFGPFLAAGAIATLLARQALVDGFAAFQRWQLSSPAAQWVVIVVAPVSLFFLFILVRRTRVR